MAHRGGMSDTDMEVTETRAMMTSEKFSLQDNEATTTERDGTKVYHNAVIQSERVVATGISVSRKHTDVGAGSAEPRVDLQFQGHRAVQNIRINSAKNVVMNGNLTINNTICPPKKKRKAKKPVTDSQELVTKDQILDLKDKLGSSWKDLGRRLGMEDHQLEHIDLECHNDLMERSYRVLTFWKEREDEKATVSKLAHVFVKIRRGDLADFLAD